MSSVPSSPSSLHANMSDEVANRKSCSSDCFLRDAKALGECSQRDCRLGVPDELRTSEPQLEAMEAEGFQNEQLQTPIEEEIAMFTTFESPIPSPPSTSRHRIFSEQGQAMAFPIQCTQNATHRRVVLPMLPDSPFEGRGRRRMCTRRGASSPFLSIGSFHLSPKTSPCYTPPNALLLQPPQGCPQSRAPRPTDTVYIDLSDRMDDSDNENVPYLDDTTPCDCFDERGSMRPPQLCPRSSRRSFNPLSPRW